MYDNDEFKGFFTGEKNFGAVGMHNFGEMLPALPCRTDKITAYHILLTAPYCSFTGKKEFEMSEFELLTAELSARLWQKYNGSIYLVTDELGAAYFREKHLDDIYNGVFSTLNVQEYGIKSEKYWASGKIQALLQVKAPCAVIDLDMLIWRPLDLSDCGLAAAHIEHITDNFYPEISFFDMSPRYSFPKEWDYTAKPLNTSFVYFNDDAFKDYYAAQSIRFMQFERDTPDQGFRCMIFAEQRILAMCAAEKNIKVKTFLNGDDVLERQNLMTHIWSGKQLLYMKKSVADQYITVCREKIKQVKTLAALFC